MIRLLTRMGLLLAVSGRLVAADTFDADVRRDTDWLAGYPSRVVGTPGHAAAQAALLAQVQAVPGVKVWSQPFPVLVPVVKRAELLVTDGPLQGLHPVYPVWPDLGRLKTTPAEGIQGRLIYVGDARLTDLPARSLKGQIAVMEMTDYERWRNPFAMGAAAVLLLGSAGDLAAEPAQQALHMPRYYVPEGDLAEALRAGRVATATLHGEQDWQTADAINILALVKPADPANALAPIAVAVPYDAMSVVLGLAPGADNAVDVAFLLNLLRETAATPPDRAVLFCFVDAYGFNQLGMRQLLSLLTVLPSDATRQAYDGVYDRRREEYRQLVEQVATLGSGDDVFDKLWDKGSYRELQRYIKDGMGPELLRLRNESGELRIAIAKTQDNPDPALEAELEQRTARTRLLNRVLTQLLTRQEGEPELLPLKRAVWQTVSDRVNGQYAAFEAHILRFEKLDLTRNAILAEMGAATNTVPVSFLLGIDLSDAGASVGPGLRCQHLWSDEAGQGRDFLRWLKQLLNATDDPFWAATPAALQVLNTAAITSIEDPRGFNVNNDSLLTSPAASFRLPSATWMTLDCRRPKLDTPQDRAERLDWNRLAPQVEVTRQMIQRLFSDPSFSLTPQMGSDSRWRSPSGTVNIESVAETVPRTPLVGCLVTLVGGDQNMPGAAAGAGVRRQEFVRTGLDGQFHFPPMAGHASAGRVLRMRVQAFSFDERGRIVQAISDSASMLAGRVSAAVNLNESPKASPPRVVAFDCEALEGPSFFDPRFLETLSHFSLIDVSRGGTPKRYQFSIHDGQMFGLLPAQTRWQLLLRAGVGDNRMILLNLDPDFPMQTGKALKQAALEGGFTLDAPLSTAPALVSARDFYTVNEWRMQRFNNAGISSRVIANLHDASLALLGEADQSIAKDDGPGLQRAASAALASGFRAYMAIRALGDDVTRGAIFLMILLVPFSVAIERLFFACRGIGRRIATGTGIFVLMTALLWSFHPSFRITSQPLVILMAFTVLLLSLVVIVIVLRRFENDMEKMRSGHAEASGAQTSRGGVIGSAVWLGIANMRKRKLRTALTATTIMLITFALLCFASSSNYQDRRQYTLYDVRSPYPGVLLHQVGMEAFDPQAYDFLDNLLADEGPLVARYWWVGGESESWRLHVRQAAGGQQISLKAALGVMPGESALTQPERFLPNWERFSQGGACYLSEGTAKSLDVRPGDSVLVAGASLELAGVFETTSLEHEWKQLDGQSMLPSDMTVGRVDMRSQDQRNTDAAMGISLVVEAVAAVGGDDLIILPADFVRQSGGDLRSMALRRPSGEDAERLAMELMNVLAFPIYYGDSNEVQVVVATPLIPRPPRNLFIPLLIAALIIFNTMLNSVAERKKEIHIYTSLGLAPRHVGILFLAESATYGLMGSVFGYIAGQGLAKVLTAFDLMGGITLNYSGSNVIMTMGMVMIVVLLSAIVPAIMAGKLATPSKDMKWRVPEPQDGVIAEQLPFTVTRAAAGGLVAFIHDFMEAHADGGIGDFTVDNLALLPPDPAYVVGLQATTWLAPYDLGVRQGMRIEVIEDVDEICNIRVLLRYESGHPRTWWRINTGFLGELRRQLLGWRNVDHARILEYISQAEGHARQVKAPESIDFEDTLSLETEPSHEA